MTSEKEKLLLMKRLHGVSQDKDTRNNHGLLANPQTSTSRFEMQQLAGLISQEVAKTVEGMQIGEVSKPFTMINAKGKEVCAIVKIEKIRIDGHKATISEDYQRLKDIVTANRSEEKTAESGLWKNKKILTCVSTRLGVSVILNIRDGLNSDEKVCNFFCSL